MRFFSLAALASALALPPPAPAENLTVTCSVTTDLLWPPNHILVDVGLDVVVAGDVNGNHVTSFEVYSDEDDRTQGSAQFSPDATSPT